MLKEPLFNKGTAYTQPERAVLGLQGLLPPRIMSIEDQLQRVRGNLARKTDPLEKYVFLTTLQNRNEVLFYKLLVSDLEEIMPIMRERERQCALDRASAARRRARKKAENA